MATGLLVLSTLALAVTGVGYLVTPALLLAVVGIESAPTSDFLIRTEGVALVCAALFVWSARGGQRGQVRGVLFGLAVYYILGSVVDLVAFAQGVVGPASVPSAAVRIVVGCACTYAMLKLPPASS